VSYKSPYGAIVTYIVPGSVATEEPRSGWAEVIEASTRQGPEVVRAEKGEHHADKQEDAAIRVANELDGLPESQVIEHADKGTISSEPRHAEPSLDWCPHEPHPKQRAFLDLTCKEAFFGGAAGGGKSDALLMAALQYVHVAGYCALIIRRTYADLSKPGAVLDRSKSWLMKREGAKWSETAKQWTFSTPDGGTAYLQFGYLAEVNDKYKYQSTEYQFIGFDEVSQFEEESYLYLFSRLRKIKALDIPLRMRSASNPGGRGHHWVMRRFVDPGTPGKVFVPSRIEDNPSLDGEEYKASLAELDEDTREQLLNGVWKVGTPKYGALTITNVVTPATYHVLRIESDVATRLGFALVKGVSTLVTCETCAVPNGGDRMLVASPAVARELRGPGRRVEPRKLRAVYLAEVCKRIEISDQAYAVLGALGAKLEDLTPSDESILDAVAWAPTAKDLEIDVDRKDPSEEELVRAENDGTHTREWWRPQSIGGQRMAGSALASFRRQ
jgi:hypothetical protein